MASKMYSTRYLIQVLACFTTSSGVLKVFRPFLHRRCLLDTYSQIQQETWFTDIPRFFNHVIDTIQRQFMLHEARLYDGLPVGELHQLVRHFLKSLGGSFGLANFWAKHRNLECKGGKPLKCDSILFFHSWKRGRLGATGRGSWCSEKKIGARNSELWKYSTCKGIIYQTIAAYCSRFRWG